jgi:outer membrane protein assembly factor BamB
MHHFLQLAALLFEKSPFTDRGMTKSSSKFYSCSCVAVALTIVIASQVLASDWPQFRGPNRDDISAETGLMKQWPSGGPPLAWKSAGLGLGYSGVSVADGRVFTAGDKSAVNHVFAMNVADGKLLWHTELGKAGAPGWGGFAGPRATPTVDGGQVFALGQYGEMACLDAATGKQLWRKSFTADFGGKLPEWGYSESLLVDGDQVVGTPGGKQGAIVALDRKTGAVKWQSKGFTDAAEYSSLIVIEYGGVRQYVQLTQASVAGVAAKDGRLLWRADRKGKVAVISTPIFHDGCVYVTSGYDVGCNLFKIAAAGGQLSAKEVYANRVIDNHHGGAVLINGYIYSYAEQGGWTCQEFKTGKVIWQNGGIGKGSLTCADGMLYLRKEEDEGTLALVEPSLAGYQEKSRFNQQDRSKKNSWPHPVIAGGKLYIRDQDVLLCYDLKQR